jgi:signal transduction histidine kinase
MDELRASVALLRSGDHEPLTPAPRLSGIDALADIARAASIDVVVRCDRGLPECSGAVELAAYRIVQEALTNVVRHSGASRAVIELGADASGDLVVEVRDDGRGPVPTPAGSAGSAGFGLTGMAERAGAVGGTIEHGAAGALDDADNADGARPGSGPGFRVRAVLPTSGTRRR